MCKQLVQFVFCWPPITFSTLANQTKALQCDTSQQDCLDTHGDTVNGSRMREDKFDCTDVLPKGYRTSTLTGAVTAKRMRRSRSKATIPRAPSSRLSISSVALFERPGGFPTSFMSSMCRSMRAPKVFARRARRPDGAYPRSICDSASVAHSRARSCRINVSVALRPLRRI